MDNTTNTTNQITLAMLQARAVEQAQADDNAETMLETGAAGTAVMLAEYLTVAGIKFDKEAPKGNPVFENACEALRVGFRSQYCNKPRHTGNKKNRQPVNMELARMVLDATEQTREGWAKDSTERKIWDAILSFGRTKLQRVTLKLWPKVSGSETGATSEAGETGEASEAETKKAPTADAILANIDAFIAEHGKDSMLAKTLRGQINVRFK
jgi:hypothetical protein